MGNLESHGIILFLFQALKVMEFKEIREVMESEEIIFVSYAIVNKLISIPPMVMQSRSTYFTDFMVNKYNNYIVNGAIGKLL